MGLEVVEELAEVCVALKVYADDHCRSLLHPGKNSVLIWPWLGQILMSLYTRIMLLFLSTIISVDSIDGGAISEI